MSSYCMTSLSMSGTLSCGQKRENSVKTLRIYIAWKEKESQLLKSVSKYLQTSCPWQLTETGESLLSDSDWLSLVLRGLCLKPQGLKVAKWVWLIKTQITAVSLHEWFFFPFVIIMSGLLLHLALWGIGSVSPKGSASSSSSFQELHSHVLVGNFQETTFLFTSPFSNVIFPSQNASRPPHQLGLGMECDRIGLASALEFRSCFCIVFVREWRHDFFLPQRIFCQCLPGAFQRMGSP